MAAYRGLKSNCQAGGAKHFLVMPDDITKDMGCELQLGKLGLNAGERKFHWEGSAELTALPRRAEPEIRGGFLTMAACSGGDCG